MKNSHGKLELTGFQMEFNMFCNLHLICKLSLLSKLAASMKETKFKPCLVLNSLSLDVNGA